jgi:hypothetical protein
VQKNVPDDTWVGATQTGTLGFYHDRTINLDGKVNPAAYYAAAEDRAPAYIASTQVRYLADWGGILHWMHEPEIRAEFEVLVDDPERNLGVLARKGLVPGRAASP